MTIPPTLDRRSFLAASATTAFVALSSQASAADLTDPTVAVSRAAP